MARTAKNTNTGRKYIHKTPNGTYAVTIDYGTYIGTYPTLADALLARDKARYKLFHGNPPPMKEPIRPE